MKEKNRDFFQKKSFDFFPQSPPVCTTLDVLDKGPQTYLNDFKNRLTPLSVRQLFSGEKQPIEIQCQSIPLNKVNKVAQGFMFSGSSSNSDTTDPVVPP